ncbi:transferrin-binding protein-like solute binding protein [Sphingomonas tabacisoli]|uniref:Transferrin-binding protein-like solute binding protein n=1 Tax=Sphingomonas tabacisoli TaxID=2249466 RepID=A0ABW4HZ33_9SPHN
MRNLVSVLPFLALAACGGAGAQSVGSNAVPTGGTPTPTSNHTFVNPTVEKTYSAIGGVQHYAYNTTTPAAGNTSTQGGQLYAGNASTARNSSISVDYNPRDGIFEVKIADANAIVNQTLRFQDPLHRTAFGGARQPQTGTPQLSANGIQYLQAGGSVQPIRFDPAQTDMVPVGDNGGSYDVSTFFYQKPGTETKYVTFAGYVRNSTSVQDVTANGVTKTVQNNVLERGAFVYGERTDNSAVPKIGTATFNGPMVATMVYNPLLDTVAGTPTYFQWVEGRSKTTVDFAANTFTLDVNGTVFAPQYDAFTSKVATLGAGATFTASGSGRVDLVGAGGFLGQFNSASFSQGGTAMPLVVAGSSIDGAFYGPAADEVGGGFRIVGGTPDQRVDIIGAFTGGK